jgi:hypothetical protein
MPSAGIRLGVDFGTSNTVAVVRWPDGRSRPLLFDGSPLLPSAVYAEPSAPGGAPGALVVGRDAVHSARLDPARFEPNPKRRIDDGTVLLGDRELPVGEMMAAVLRRVRDEWRRTVGGVDPDTTLTFPASWGATRRLVLADAAGTAGLGRVRLVPEPVAAAAYFTQVLGREVPIGAVVVVHDFGAGTFDASVVARTSSGFEVLAVDGRDDIGGIDVDNAIVAKLGELCQQRDAAAWERLIHPATVEDRRARRLLWDDARVAKERLSRTPAADLTVPLLNVDIHFTRQELEELARPLLDQTIRVTQGVIRWAQLAQGRIAGVFLVGGSSRIPLVATMLHQALGEAPVAIEQPELVVAEGSIVGDAAAIPVTAGPAPGPATGAIPTLPPVTGEGGFTMPPDLRPMSGPPNAAPSTSPSNGDGPMQPVSGMPLWGSPSSVSGPPASSTPVSAPPNRATGRVFASGSASVPHPVSSQPVSTPPPMSAPPASWPPASAPPVSPAAPYPQHQQPQPQHQQPQPQHQQPQPQQPQHQQPQVQQPQVQQPQYPPTQVQQPVRRPVQQPQVQPYPQPIAPTRRMERLREPPRPPQPGYAQPSTGGKRAGRAFVTFLVVLLLIAVPLVAGYIAYYLSAGEWPPPVNGWFPSAR